jgi:hypothetical protein
MGTAKEAGVGKKGHKEIFENERGIGKKGLK